MRFVQFVLTRNLAAVLLVILGSWCGSAASASAPVPEVSSPAVRAAPEELAAANSANGQFAIDLYRQLIKENDGKSIFASPFSIATALTMATEGAAGDTAKEMANLLHLPAAAQQGGNSPALAALHRGQAGLAAKFAPPEVPAAIREKVQQLRTQLEAANRQVGELQEGNKFREAQQASATGRRLANELNQLLKTVDQYELRIANALWAEKTYPFKQSYLNALQPTYGAVLYPVDFKRAFEPARVQINQWVERQTNDRIKDLIAKGMLDEYTRLVITNAVYFKGEWATPFDKEATREGSFLTGGNANPKLPLMQQRNSETASYAAFDADGMLFKTPREIPVDMKETDPSLYPADGGFTMLSLPYKGQKLSMVWLLPRSATGIPDLEKLLGHDKLQVWLKQGERRTVDITVPRFKLETNYGLVLTLKSLGMVRAFVNPLEPNGAQFDNMSESQDPMQKLYIANVLHKTFVEVNEKGTEAAAATAVIFAAPTAAPGFLPPKLKPFVPIFKANQPFLFLIRDTETGSVLFLGRYLGPQG